MNMQEWVNRIGAAKHSVRYSRLDLRVGVSPDGLTRLLRLKISEETCSKCGQSMTNSGKTVIVKLHKPIEHFSIFEAELLYELYAENKRPYDYAGFHKCPAGREFIGNIAEVTVA